MPRDDLKRALAALIVRIYLHGSLHCSDIPAGGKRHQEIFTFTRLQGRDIGGEWDLIIGPVVRRWTTFVSTYVVA